MAQHFPLGPIRVHTFSTHHSQKKEKQQKRERKGSNDSTFVRFLLEKHSSYLENLFSQKVCSELTKNEFKAFNWRSL